MEFYSLEITKKLDFTENLEPYTINKSESNFKIAFLSLSNILDDFA